MKDNGNIKNFKQEFKKRCFKFSLAILNLCNILSKGQVNRPLLDQLIRSATSIGANVVEGGNSVSKKEFINYFHIALKSSSETLYWLALLREVNNEQRSTLDGLIDECIQLKKILSTVILNTKNHSKL